MQKSKNNEFILDLNQIVIRELKNYIKLYNIKDEKDVKDLNELINYKESLIKAQEKMQERIQILKEEEK